MRAEIYVHIGRPKTGTTAIQNFLYKYRQTLINEGVLYPDCGILDNAHHLVAISLLRNLPDSIAHLPRKESRLLKDELLAQIDKFKPEKIILSSEFFSLMTPEKDGELKKNLKSFFNGPPVRIISYFRPQAAYLESSYNQEIKNHAMKIPVEFESYAKMFLARKVNDYYWSCNKWASVFGNENVIVRPFEKKQLYNEDVVADMLNILDVNSVYEKYTPEKSINVSLTAPRMLLVNALAELELNDVAREKLLQLIMGIPELRSERGKFSILDPKTVTEIDDAYSISNANLAKEYLDLNGGKLFHANRRSPEYKEYKTLKFEFIYEFIHKIYDLDKEAYEILKNAISTKSNNDSLNVIRNLMENNFSVVAGMHYYLDRISNTLH